ncbi:hypothetical protein CCP2SC5_60045 [Azospirillaceae bacterium]
MKRAMFGKFGVKNRKNIEIFRIFGLKTLKKKEFSALFVVLTVFLAFLLAKPAYAEREASKTSLISLSATMVDGPIPDLWEMVRDETMVIFDYGSTWFRSLLAWASSFVGGAEPASGGAPRELMTLSEKEFREFDALVAAAGFRLNEIRFGIGSVSTVELTFEFKQVIGDKERAALERRLNEQRESIGPVRGRVIVSLLDSAKQIGAISVDGFRIIGVFIRVGSSFDVKINYRRTAP